MLTVKMLKAMPEGTIFARGETVDSPEGINMNNTGRQLHWVAKRGIIHDWAIYYAPADWSDSRIAASGDKVSMHDNIKKLIECDDEALEMYRL